MHPAEALDRDDFSLADGRAGQGDRVALLPDTVCIQIEHMRPADRAAVGLGVVAAILDVVVFPVAVGAHRKLAHAGERPVVGHVLNDRKARPAVGAVDEGIAIAPVARAQQLAAAVVAQGDIRRDQRIAHALGPALEDAKIREVPQLVEIFGLNVLDHGQHRRTVGQFLDKALERRPLALQLQLDAGGCILDRAGQSGIPDLLVDEGAEAHALHNTVNMDQCSYQENCTSLSPPMG